MIGNVNFASMMKWPFVRGVHEFLEIFLQISCKVTAGFFQITRKVKAVIWTLDTKYSRPTFCGLPQDVCYGICNPLNCKMYSFTLSHPNSVKRSWETVHLRRVRNFAWGVFLLGVGRKLDEELFWQFDSVVIIFTIPS